MPAHLPIRPATRDDQAAVVELARGNLMFGEDEIGGFAAAFADSVDGAADGHRWFVSVSDAEEAAGAGGAGRIVAAAYLAPEPFADRLWNLYFIAVDPSWHGRGVGSALIGHVEELLRAAGEAQARVLLVETSSTGQYEATRAFYLARGFDEEARIREFYGPGDDKVVFWKRLTAS